MPDIRRKDAKVPNYQVSHVRLMTEVEAAWVGAMIEAEGSVAFHPPSSKHVAKVTVVNTDPEIISAMLRLTGSGTVHFGQARTRVKPVFVWWMAKWREVQDLVRQCAPYSMKLQRVRL